MTAAFDRGLGLWWKLSDGGLTRSSEVEYRVLFQDPRRAAGKSEVFLTSTNGAGWGLEGYVRWRAGSDPTFEVWNRGESGDGRPGEDLPDVQRYFDKVTRLGVVLYALTVYNRTTRREDGSWLNDVWVHGKPGWKCVDKTTSPHAARRFDQRRWGPVVELIGAETKGLGVVGFEGVRWLRDKVPARLDDGACAWRWGEAGLRRLTADDPALFLVSA